MSQRAKRPCRKRGCGGLTIERHGYCQEHESLGCNWNKKERGTSTERGYGYQWQKKRKRIIQRDNGLCQVCLVKDVIRAGKEVDHILNKAEGGTDSDSNLQCICVDCHKEKTKRESLRARVGG